MTFPPFVPPPLCGEGEIGVRYHSEAGFILWSFTLKGI